MKTLPWLKRAFSTILLLGLLLSSVPQTVVQRLGQRAEGNVAYALPFLTASKADVLVIDNDNDGIADPGDTIRYTTPITNSGNTNAINVQFNDTIDVNTSLVAGSLKTTPLARNDGIYFSVGNVGISVPAGSGVLANDDDPDGGAVSVVAFDATSANGGNVSVAGDGSFTYLPAPGFEGSDSFGYTIQDGDGFQDPAFASLIVSDVIWFVDNAAGVAGDGRLGSPFNSLSAYNSTAADDPGDVIYFYTGSGAYGGGIALQANQTLIGQGAGASISAITGIIPPTFSSALPTTGGAKPALTNSAGAAISLASGNLVRGLAASNSGGTGLAGTGVNTLTIQEVDVSNTTAEGIRLTNLLGTATFDNLSVIGSGTHNVLIENSAGTAIIGLTNSTVNGAGSGDGFAVIGTGSAGITLNVSDSSFTHNNAAQLKAHARGNSTVDANIIGNAFDGDPAVTGNVGLDLAVRDGASLTFDVIGSGSNPQTFQPFVGQVINVFASGGGTATGRLQGNTVLGSAFGSGVRAIAEVDDVGGTDPAITIEVKDNTISNIGYIGGSGSAGIHVVSQDSNSSVTGTANVQATIDNNSVTINGADSVIQALANGGNTLCLAVTNNSAAGANTSLFAGMGSTHYIGNPVFGTTGGPGNVTYAGYAGDLASAWNANSNSPTLTGGNGGEAFVDGTLPTGGTCTPVASSLPQNSGTALARADDPAADVALATLDALALTAFTAVSDGVQSLGTTLRHVDLATLSARAGETAAQWAANLASGFGPSPAYASGETINLPLADLNAGQVVLITFDVTVDLPLPPNVPQVCNQGVVSSANFSDVLTDDFAVGGSVDPTCTFIDVPPTPTPVPPTFTPTFTPTPIPPTPTSTPTPIPPTSTPTSTPTPIPPTPTPIPPTATPTSVPPAIAVDQASVTVNEGQTATNTGTVSDADGDTVSLSASLGAATNNGNGTWSWSALAADGPRSETVTVYGDDGNGGTGQASFGLTVLNVAPSIVAILAPPAPVSLQDPLVGVTAVFTDPVLLNDEPYTCAIDFGDGSGTQHGLVDDDECSGSHTYAAPGVYALSVAVTDKDNATGSGTYQYVVVYAEGGGFVTGGGWIDSPLGAYTPDPTRTGKATFGFVSKYDKGQSLPDGNTQFQFQAADLSFHSSSYDWLVVAGHKAMFKGAGTINGIGNYGFLLSAIDAAQTPSVDVDRFRIKIWDIDAGDAVVYDNQVACAEAGDDADPCTAIGGGSIVVHTGKKK